MTRRRSLRYLVLEAICALGKPVGSKDILRYLRRRYDVLRGKTPRNSIQAAVWMDIHTRKSKSPFKMVGGPGRNQWKYWLNNDLVREMKARIKMSPGQRGARLKS